jgi:DNA-binding CsgD family transcriptional regulator
MSVLVLKIGEINKQIDLEIDISRKTILIVRDAFRKAGVEADVILKQTPKILD